MANQELATTNFQSLLETVLPFSGKVEASYRLNGLKNFSFPTKKEDDWRYSPTKSISGLKIESFHGKTFEDVLAPASTRDAIEVVFVNGFYSEKLSKLKGLYPDVRISIFKKALEENKIQPLEEKWFRALNQAFFENGVYLEIQKEVRLKTPIVIRHLTNTKARNFMASPRVFVRVLPFSSAEIVEIFEDGSTGEYFVNDICDFEVFPGAQIHHLRILNSSERSTHTGHMRFEMYRDSELNSCVLSTGGALSRTQVDVVLKEQGAQANLSGLNLLADVRKTENHVSVVHAAEGTISRQEFKSILTGSSHGVFQGKVNILPVAQKSVSEQLNKNLILGDKAHVDTKPQLDVGADDVKATHGATVGQLDPEEVFYLQTRGFSPGQSKSLICRGFALSILDTIKSKWICENVKNWLEQSVSTYTEGV